MMALVNLNDLPWQDIIAGLMGVGALVHVARRWWPRSLVAGKGAAPSGCGSCDSGCGSAHTANRQVCDHPEAARPEATPLGQGANAHRVIPITQETPSA